jgi:hypothetical protein
MSFFEPNKREDPRRCRVCGHLTVTPVRRTLTRLLMMVIGALVCYVALDVAEDGRLDGGLHAWLTAAAAAFGTPPSPPPVSSVSSPRSLWSPYAAVEEML